MLDQPVTLEAANAYIERGNLEDAEEVYRSLLGHDPGNCDALFGYGVFCLKTDRHRQAIDHFRKAALLSPGNIDIQLNFSFASYLIGQVGEAKEILIAARAHHPDAKEISDLQTVYETQPNLFFSGALQGAHAPQRQVFLSATVDLLKQTPPPLRILEIGSYMGCSVLTWADAADRLYGQPCTILSVDPWGDAGAAQYKPSVEGALRSQSAYDIYRHNISFCPDGVTVDHVRGTSQSVLENLRGEHFDIVYVDGCHFFAETRADIEGSDRLLKSGGIMCGDDLEIQAGDCDIAFAKAHFGDDYVRDPKTGAKFHPGVTLAVAEYFGEVSAFSGFWAMRKTGDGYEKVDYRRAMGVLPKYWGADHHQRIKAYFVHSSELGTVIS